MLTLNQVSVLFPKSPCLSRDVVGDDNNNSSPLSCGAMALKMLSSSVGPRRCLFGSPSTEETQRLLKEDLEAARARMLRRWGWDTAKDAGTRSTNWQWESVKAPSTSTPVCQTKAGTRRHHPYSIKRASAENIESPFTVPIMVSPLPDTPRLIADVTASPASSSGTSTLPASPSSTTLEDSSSSPSSEQSASSPTSELSSESEDSCCGGSETGSDSEQSNCALSERANFVQTRLTDFWRTRRFSGSEGANKTTASSAASKGSASSVAPTCTA